MSYNRKDNDGHRYNVPEDLLEDFDSCLWLLCNAVFLSNEYYEAQTNFCNQFEEYMVG